MPEGLGRRSHCNIRQLKYANLRRSYMKKRKGFGKDYPAASLNARRALKKADRRHWINRQKAARANHIPQ